jgi:hypothetical protein
MTKIDTLTPVTNLSTGSAVMAINENYDKIVEAFNNTVSRDGSMPNHMDADLDMNGNDILNVHTIEWLMQSLDVEELTVGGQNINDLVDIAVAASAAAASSATDADADASAAAADAAAAQAAADAAEAAAALIPNLPVSFRVLGDLTADTNLSYSGGGAVIAGTTYVTITSKGWLYVVAPSGSSDYHIITAGGVKVYASPVNGYVNIEQFIQAGYASSAVDILSSFTKAIATGYRLKGDPAHIYGVTGKITPLANTWLEDISVKQLAPHATTSVVTIGCSGVSSLTFKRVTVDRNGDGTGGSLLNAAGISITGGSKHFFEDVEVFGSDAGTGFTITSATNFKVIRPLIHDIIYVSASLPANDQTQGLWLSACSDFSVIEPNLYTIRGIVGGSPRQAFGRPLAIGLGCSYFRIIGGEIYDADVGVDLTGSAGNFNFVLMGITVRDVETWGIKLANYNRFGTVMGCNVHRAGSAGFVGSGPTVDVDPDSPVPSSLPQHVTFIGCGAWSTGFGNTGRGTSQPAGFLVTPGAAPSYQDYPRGYRFIGCTAYDNQTVKTQYHGFRNETNFGGQPMNEVINCKSGGYAAGGQHVATFPYPACCVFRSTAQAIPNNAATAIDWGASEDFDGASMHSGSSNTDTVFVQEAGWYRVEAAITFAANGTGLRALSCTVGGVTKATLFSSQPGSAVNDTTCNFSGLVYISDITGGIKVLAFQNSGGSLNVIANKAMMTVSKAMPNN